ncbi:hypothetical protein Y032_0361g3483 [Ancylostoma ceylanicum]|uniref:Uncharacterized protein n=1 Tax=Ancylostoma ceylanicum TaxID=53326 RepID=A0A016RVH2_9BILA|nr:hypothetical protein Y032_0361g3483 [Ancylostoma ceylanicum]
MIAQKFSKFRAHFVATCMAVGVTLLAYGAYKTGAVIKGWVNAAPRLQHEEMEDYLRYKEREARLKALKSEKQ